MRPDVTYDDVLSSDLVVVVSADLREELPVLFLRMRIAATKRNAADRDRAPARGVAVRARGRARRGRCPATRRPSRRRSPAATTDGDVGALADALRDAQRPVILLGPRAHDAATVKAWRAVAERDAARS